MKNNFIKSPLNYTGGKHKLLPQIIPLLPPPPSDEIIGNQAFIDLFTGGANVIANINGYKLYANDIDINVINIYKSFQSSTVDDIIKYINEKIKEYDLTINNADGYNLFRKHFNESEIKNPLDLFILICFSFNHQIRFNSKGEFNMPFGKERSCYNKTIENNLIKFHDAIKEVNFNSIDFRKLKVHNLKKGDYVYCDPPYLITCASYNEKDGWNENDERDLLKLLDTLDEKGVYFGLSNVLENKGKQNTILNEWIENNNYVVYHLNNTYSNCSYHGKNKETTTDEVFITNYKK